MQYLLDPTNWDVTIPDSIPNLFFDHLTLTFISVVIGLLIAFPIHVAALVQGTAKVNPLFAYGRLTPRPPA